MGVALLGCQFDTFGSNSAQSQSGSVGETADTTTSGDPTTGADPSEGTQTTTTTTSPISTLPQTVSGPDDDDQIPSSTSGTATDVDPTATDGPSSSTGTPEGLVDGGVIVRYFLDESDMGTSPTAVLDSTDQPLHLLLDYAGTELEYVELGGNRGLRWNSAGSSAAPRENIAKSELMNLAGAGQLTIEVVLTLQAGLPMTSRIFHVGEGGQRGLVSLGTTGPQELVFSWNNNIVREWEFQDTESWEHRVVHLVVDTSAPSQVDRVTLFVDGIAIQSSSSEPVGAADTVVPFTNINNTILALGNRDQERSFEGILYYAAMYGRALTDDEIANNVEVLLDDDDSP